MQIGNISCNRDSIAVMNAKMWTKVRKSANCGFSSFLGNYSEINLYDRVKWLYLHVIRDQDNIVIWYRILILGTREFINFPKPENFKFVCEKKRNEGYFLIFVNYFPRNEIIFYSAAFLFVFWIVWISQIYARLTTRTSITFGQKFSWISTLKELLL